MLHFILNKLFYTCNLCPPPPDVPQTRGSIACNPCPPPPHVPQTRGSIACNPCPPPPHVPQTRESIAQKKIDFYRDEEKARRKILREGNCNLARILNEALTHMNSFSTAITKNTLQILWHENCKNIQIIKKQKSELTYRMRETTKTHNSTEINFHNSPKRSTKRREFKSLLKTTDQFRLMIEEQKMRNPILQEQLKCRNQIILLRINQMSIYPTQGILKFFYPERTPTRLNSKAKKFGKHLKITLDVISA